MKFSIDTFFIPVRGYFPPKMYVYDDKKKIILYAAKLVNLDNNLFAAFMGIHGRSGFFSKPAYKVIDNDGQLLATIKGDCLCYINGYLLCRIKSDSIIHSFLNRRFLIVKDSDVIGILTREFNIFRSNYTLDMSGDLQKSIDRRIILSIVFIFILSIYHSSSGD